MNIEELKQRAIACNGLNYDDAVDLLTLLVKALAERKVLADENEELRSACAQLQADRSALLDIQGRVQQVTCSRCGQDYRDLAQDGVTFTHICAGVASSPVAQGEQS